MALHLLPVLEWRFGGERSMFAGSQFVQLTSRSHDAYRQVQLELSTRLANEYSHAAPAFLLELARRLFLVRSFF
jgi:hypothetical protein